LDSRTICKKTEAKLLKWLEQITEESHWTVELSAKKNRSKTIKMTGTNNRRIALDSRTICKKTEAKLLKWLEQITEESHWTVELSVKNRNKKY
jgi:hypothetical protein